jgi:hypothetical protein
MIEMAYVQEVLDNVETLFKVGDYAGAELEYNNLSNMLKLNEKFDLMTQIEYSYKDVKNFYKRGEKNV